MNDMELVARIMHPGGIIIVDDFVNPGWVYQLGMFHGRVHPL